MKGQLEVRLVELRSLGTSWDDVSLKLYQEGGVEVSTVTLRAWAKALGITDREAVA